MVFGDLFEIFIFQVDDDSTIEVICSDIFDINNDWYAGEEFDNADNIIYQPPPLHNVWLDERVRRDWKQDLVQKRRCTEYRICGRNRAMTDIVMLNIKDYGNFYPTDDPISDDELSVDSSVGLPPS